ncbi:MAG: bifunctional folylpolyglutamate synthase/dihydrofolate synthase, partial [Planctomycetes bacterium]|nr:bifunctional folylpolyglutamate synthase/dihydrofolate synthase [Planctomycetota bacterium]
MLRTLEEAMEALSRLTNYERTRPDGPRAFDLSRMRQLLRRLGSPDRRLGARVVQVAGTKGKGSTSRYVDAILRAAGLRTGRYLSPHLESVRERIAVDDVLIPEADFAFHVGTVLAASGPATTFFEALTASACLHFAAARTDAVVLEVGIGGRLDATTAVPTTHTVITEISFDHTELLGSTLEAIAAEKAATIRTGVPVFSGVDPATGPGRVIRDTAARLDAPFRHVPPPPDVRPE